jgi:hypothetical protein
LPVLLSFQSWKKYNKWQKFSKWPYVTLPNNYKKYRMAVKYPSKIYKNWGVGYENIPSGNPCSVTSFVSCIVCIQFILIHCRHPNCRLL